jgi:LacI family transcriptional regulator
VEDVAQSAGYSALLCNSDESPDKEQQYLDIAEQSRVTGVLITATSPAVDVHRLLAGGVPVVALDRPVRGPESVDAVLVDSRGAARTAVEHLVAAGHRRIACITGPRRVFTAAERALGYREALQDAGIAPDPGLLHYADFKIAGARDAAREVLKSGDLDALLVTNSLMAVGVLEVIAEQGLTIGSDIDIVAFDDAPWTGLLSTSISVVRQPAYELGRAADEARALFCFATLPR